MKKMILLLVMSIIFVLSSCEIFEANVNFYDADVYNQDGESLKPYIKSDYVLEEEGLLSTSFVKGIVKSKLNAPAPGDYYFMTHVDIEQTYTIEIIFKVKGTYEFTSMIFGGVNYEKEDVEILMHEDLYKVRFDVFIESIPKILYFGETKFKNKSGSIHQVDYKNRYSNEYKGLYFIEIES